MGEWKEVKLGEIATIIDCEHKTASKVESSNFYSVRTSNISNGKIDFEGANRVSESTYTEWTKRGIPEEGDIILAREAPVGEVGFVKKGYKVCLGQRTVLIKVFSKNVSSKYLLYHFVSPQIKHELRVRSVGSVVSHLNMKDIRAFPLKLPPLPEQKAIATILTSLDDKIDLLHRQNKTLEAMAETLFRQWFVEEEVQYLMLGDCIKTTSGGTPSRKRMEFYENGKYQWVKSKELNRGYILGTEEKITEEALNNSSAKLLPKNSVLIAMYGATVGQFGIIGQEATCNQAVCACIPNEKFPYTFIYYTIKANEEELKSRAVGSAQQNISQVLIRQLEIPVDDKKIEKYHTKVHPIMDRIKGNSTQIRTLATLRDTLLPKLMNGTVRVSEL